MLYLLLPFNRSIEDRYKSIAEVAKTRSILSLGLSCFKIQDEEEDHNSREGETPPGPGPTSQKFLAQTFNILTLCNEDYMVEPGALQFLVGHGFDFNKQYSCGVPYCRGPDRVSHLQGLDLFLGMIFCCVIKSFPSLAPGLWNKLPSFFRNSTSY